MVSKTLEEWCKENNRMDLLEEWHPMKNNDLMPFDVSYSKNIKVWWQCALGHEWEDYIGNRSCHSRRCPFCSGRRTIKGSNDLATVKPEIAKEWHPAKNDGLKPDDVLCGSNKKVWWKCSLGHEWQAIIHDRVDGTGCPYCSNRKVLQGFNDLQTKMPEIAKEWHDEKNNDIKPTDVTCGSGKKVWWKCELGHEWKTTVLSRTGQGTGCPICAGKRALNGYNDLVTTNPDIVKEWDYEKNTSLNPYDVTSGSEKKVWWKCSLGHEWKVSILSRARQGTGCPYCSGRKIWAGYNDLQTLRPDLLTEWNYEKNELRPNQVGSGSHQKIWWICKKGHEWKTSIYNRTKGTGCPYCSNKKIILGYNDLATLRPELAKEWDYEKNKGLVDGNGVDISTPEKVSVASGNNVWWKCQYGHEWKSTIVNRVKGNGCPKCSNNGTSLPEQGIAYYLEQICKVEQRVKIAGQEVDVYLPEYRIGIEYDGERYHTEKKREKELLKESIVGDAGVKLIRIKESDNNIVINNYICFESDYLRENYEWALNQLCQMLESLTHNEEFRHLKIDLKEDTLKIRERVNLFHTEHSLFVVNPSVAKEWHPTKNGTLTPEMLYARSNIKVWWKCNKGHEWKAVINSRASGNFGCPVCSGRIAKSGENDLATLFPNIAEEWHPTKNDDLKPSDVRPGSHEKVWWLCSKCGYEWTASIAHRTRDRGCPMCGLKKCAVSRMETFIMKNGSLKDKYPEIAKEWHPTQNGELKSSDVTCDSNKKVWWLCSKCGYEWQTIIANRKNGKGCPICGRKKGTVSRMKTFITNKGSLEDKYPEIAKEWHTIKNADIKPVDVTCSSGKKVWWICPKKHEYQARIADRTSKNRGCPFCSGNRVLVGFNDLITVCPEVAKEWHPIKNGELSPKDVSRSCGKKVWWLCSKCGQEWEAYIYSRTGKTKSGCPYCAGRRKVISQ